MLNGIIKPNQLGFLPGNRASDAHLILHNLIDRYCHTKKQNLYGCFVDFSKAFDNIPRDKLLKKLLNYGITGRVFDTIKHLYEDDKTFIKIGGSLSQEML